MKYHGHEEYLSFTEEELVQMRNYFNSIDTSGTGSIGVE
jgi:Ca2+-binding EF-hand superfamily protein